MKIKKYFIISLILVLSVILTSCGFKDKSKGIFITKWDNLYEENNIHFYYNDGESPNSKQLKDAYKLDDLVKGEKDNLKKSINIVGWLNNSLKYSKNSIKTAEDVLSILEESKKGSTASDKEFTKVFSESAASLGIYSRIGEYKVKDSQHEKDKVTFNVCEIWSNKYKKWIMIDVVNGVYMIKKEIPLSAVEVLQNNIKSLQIVGVKKTGKYIKDYGKYFNSYTISIDNNLNDGVKSNSNITYMKDKDIPEIKTNKGYIKPTIFVNKDTLFKISPLDEYKNNEVDKKATIIISKKKAEGKSDSKEGVHFYLGAFKNSAMIEDYYISINGSKYGKVKKYFDLKIREGKNSIKLSEGGKKEEREIVIELKN